MPRHYAVDMLDMCVLAVGVGMRVISHAVRVGMFQTVPLPARDVGAQKALRLEAELLSAEDKVRQSYDCSCGDCGIAVSFSVSFSAPLSSVCILRIVL